MRTQRLELRLTEAERAADEAAAAVVGETLSVFFRRAAGDRAAEVLADERRITLSEEEAIRFLDALESVPSGSSMRLSPSTSRRSRAWPNCAAGREPAAGPED